MKKVALIFLINIGLALCASTKKKTTEASETTEQPGPAILAIEIVDGNDNSTDVRNNTKRTIESALGYGFQGNYYTTNQGKKYMVYPYSQRDIPPSQEKPDASKYLSQTLKIQKSVSYNSGAKIGSNVATGKQLFTPAASQAYVQPNSGYYPSTLFSTVGQSGQIGGLTTNFPAQAQTAASVPVIILRVYSNQLSDNAAIYPNLPQTHPYASNLNSVNLQSILANYLQQQYYQAQQAYKPVYQAPSAAYQGQDYAYQGQLGYQGQLAYQDQGLGYQGQNLVYQGQNLGYYQMQPNLGAYQQEQQQQAQPQIDYKALEQSAAQLPTHENYPDEAHTRVIYHGPKGHIEGVSYSASNQEYQAPAQSQTQTYTESQSYAPASASDSQQIYTDSHGQSYIYVKPSQLQNLNYYQQPYQQQDYQNQEYQQPEQQTTYQSSYQQEKSNNRQYLPVPQSNSDKVYNYHAQASNEPNERAKKSSGSPVTFDSKKLEKKTKRNQ